MIIHHHLPAAKLRLIARSETKIDASDIVTGRERKVLLTNRVMKFKYR